MTCSPDLGRSLGGRAGAALLGLAASGCASAPATNATDGATSAVLTAASTTASALPAAATVFDVHEWGLLDVTTTSARLTAGPPSGPTNWNAPRRKPVLYFHLGDGVPSIDASVTVSVPGASSVVEHFPAGNLGDPRTLVWRGLHVRRESCHVSSAPSRDAPQCKTADGVCEAAELATYESPDAGCIEFGGAPYNHLFYRANGPPPPLPFDVTSHENQIAISHARAPDARGSILYVHNDGGVVTVSTIATPALGQSIKAEPPKDSDVAAAERVLRAEAREAGLTDPEMDAFDRAWKSDLFGGSAARETPRRAALAPDDYLLFVMPASLLDGASSVAITPAPRSLRRFLLVRLHV